MYLSCEASSLRDISRNIDHNTGDNHPLLADPGQYTVPCKGTLRRRRTREDLPTQSRQLVENKQLRIVPIPPRNERIDLFLFVRVLEKIQDRIIEPFGIRDCVAPREDGGRT